MAISNHELLALLHEGSPYTDHDVARHPGDMQGWGSTDPLFQDVISAVRPEVIVEVGTWKGASAIHMAQTARRLGLSSQIICVDTWLGSPEHFLGTQISWRQSLRIQNGYPQLYFTFLTNVIERGVTEFIVPLPATSENAAVILRKKNILPDLVYIDGAHEYAVVKRDLEIYWSLLKDNGILFGDDYIRIPDVTRAVNDFANERRLEIVGQRGKFLLSKNPLLVPRIVLARQTD